MLLEVVGWQPVILRDDELLEIGPGLAGDPAQERCLFPAQLGRGGVSAVG